MLYALKSLKDTIRLGRTLADHFSGGEIVLLDGELGSGKTALTQGIAEGLAISQQIISPTFTLMNEYVGRLRLFHFDLYRLQQEEEFFAAGLEEYLGQKDGVCVIEWAAKFPGIFQSCSVMRIRMAYDTENDSGRTAAVTGICQQERL